MTSYLHFPTCLHGLNLYLEFNMLHIHAHTHKTRVKCLQIFGRKHTTICVWSSHTRKDISGVAEQLSASQKRTMLFGVGSVVSYDNLNMRYYCLFVRVGFRLQTSKLSILTQLQRNLLCPSKSMQGKCLKLHCDNPSLHPLTYRKYYWIIPKEIPYLPPHKEHFFFF